jgi:hypothetical protein
VRVPLSRLARERLDSSAPNGGERLQTTFIGMDYLDLCTTGTKAFNRLVDTPRHRVSSIRHT